MAGLNVTARNAMLDAAAAVWPPQSISLHGTDPGAGVSATAGTEVSGGTPAYARKTAVWGAATGGTKTLASTAFDVPDGAVVGFIGYWTGTTYLGCRENRDDAGNITVETFGNQGTFTVTGIVETSA
jgi:hypothetical protein